MPRQGPRCAWRFGPLTIRSWAKRDVTVNLHFFGHLVLSAWRSYSWSRRRWMIAVQVYAWRRIPGGGAAWQAGLDLWPPEDWRAYSYTTRARW